jgi:hypothetical protein
LHALADELEHITTRDGLREIFPRIRQEIERCKLRRNIDPVNCNYEIDKLTAILEIIEIVINGWDE